MKILGNYTIDKRPGRGLKQWKARAIFMSRLERKRVGFGIPARSYCVGTKYGRDRTPLYAAGCVGIRFHGPEKNPPSGSVRSRLKHYTECSTSQISRAKSALCQSLIPGTVFRSSDVSGFKTASTRIWALEHISAGSRPISRA